MYVVGDKVQHISTCESRNIFITCAVWGIVERNVGYGNVSSKAFV